MNNEQDIPILKWTWEEICERWPIPEFMESQLLLVAGLSVDKCSFEQNGRWLIAIAPDSVRWYYDDTTGEWIVPDDEEELDV
jgi:hypothetical protein